MLALNFVD